MASIERKRAEQTLKFDIKSLSDTAALAKIFAENVRGGSIIGLTGPLGVGKTEFVKNFARSLGIDDSLPSPTFVLEVVYNIPSYSRLSSTTLHHWDFYRLGENGENFELSDYVGDESKILVIEWPERVKWVEDLLDIKISISFPECLQTQQQGCSFVEDDQRRAFRVQAAGRPNLISALEQLQPEASSEWSSGVSKKKHW